MYGYWFGLVGMTASHKDHLSLLPLTCFDGQGYEELVSPPCHPKASLPAFAASLTFRLSPACTLLSSLFSLLSLLSALFLQNHADKHPSRHRRLPHLCAGLSRPAVSASDRATLLGERRVTRSRRAITLTNWGCPLSTFRALLVINYLIQSIYMGHTSHMVHIVHIVTLRTILWSALRKSLRGLLQRQSFLEAERYHSTCPNQPPCFAPRPFLCE